MADDPSILVQVGIRVQDVLGGFAGGVVNAIIFKRADPWSVMGSCIVGALTANYLTGTAVKYFGTSPEATAFLVGLGGMALCQTLFNKIITAASSAKTIDQSKTPEGNDANRPLP